MGKEVERGIEGKQRNERRKMQNECEKFFLFVLHPPPPKSIYFGSRLEPNNLARKLITPNDFIVFRI